MLFTPIYIVMTFIRSWRIRSFRVKLLEFLSENTSVAFCKVPEDAAETPSLSSKLCTNPKNAYLCDLLDYTNTTRICSMKPNQCIDLHDWVSCSGSMPLGSGTPELLGDLDLELLLECEMEQSQGSERNITPLDTMGSPVAWKAGTHLAIVLKTNIELLSVVGLNFVAGEFTIDHRLPVVRIQTIQLCGEPNKATDPSMRSLRSEVQHSLKNPPREFQWPIHAALLRKLSKVVDIKSDIRNTTIGMNGNTDIPFETTNIERKAVSLADVSVNTTKSLTEDDSQEVTLEPTKVTLELTTERNIGGDQTNDKNIVLSKDNVTVEIQHNITPKKSSLKLDLRKGTSQLSASLMNISSQIKSVTTHKKVLSTTGPKKSQPVIEPVVKSKEELNNSKSESKHGTPKSAKSSRPLINTKSPNVLIFSDSVVARDNLEASLKMVLNCDRYTIYSVNRSSLEGGWWRGRAALLAVAGEVGRAAPLLLAHLLDGGRLLALCSDLLHTVLPHYTTAEVRENEIVQFSYDKWQSVKMKHHIFCYQASPAKKQFSTESDRQPSKYTGHPGHEIDIQVLASEETWRTPSLLQATDLTNSGVAIFSQIHLETDPSDYLAEEGTKSNEARLEILQKILGDILGMHVRDIKDVVEKPQYTPGYFLGNHVHKLSIIESLGSHGVPKLGDISVQWLFKGDIPKQTPSADFLPIHVYECPENFSTVEYYDNLTSRTVGRVVVYADVLSCTQSLCTTRVWSGAGVVARVQSHGRGRGGNLWLSPVGCALMSLQIHVELNSKVSLLQQCAALAAVRAIRTLTHYQHLDIRIKWPNDIYFGRDTKIGGVVTTASCEGDEAIVTIGTGVNITNSIPTSCVNDIIAAYNRRESTTIPSLTVEKFLARYCSQLEHILDYLNTDGGVQAFLEQYYTYWLHDDEEVKVKLEGKSKPVVGKICGVDEGGWLRVRTPAGELKVQPDGNTFDMMAGLIAPKQQ